MEKPVSLGFRVFIDSKMLFFNSSGSFISNVHPVEFFVGYNEGTVSEVGKILSEAGGKQVSRCSTISA